MSTSTDPTSPHYAVAPNAQRLLWAGFMAILAAGVGFSVRGASVLEEWSKAFGFTQTELGGITGGGLVGFGVIIIISSFLAEKIGFGRLMFFAFIVHFLSAVVTLAAPAVFTAAGKDATFWCLFVGMFMFAIGNGVCEAVVNPLVATLFPNNKTHYLNILHAGWPAGLILGGVASIFLAGNVSWQIQISLFLLPVILYGIMIFGQRMPSTESSVSGMSIGQILLQFGSPLLLFLLVIHAMVGYVELGTDSWIARITGSILDETTGRWLFVYTSALMFILRFVAGPIVHRISPLGLLFGSAILATIGLYTLGGVGTTVAAIGALTVYGLGKTFFWPTMLAVVSERFPKGGAVTLGMVGGVGMLSAGLLGGPGIGFKQDKYASEQLESQAPEVFNRYKAAKENRFLVFETNGLDGAKVATLGDDGKKLAGEMEILQETNTSDPNIEALNTWWQDAQTHAAADKQPVTDATLNGSRMALKLTAIVPAVMAVCYLILLFYFKSIGGYKALKLEDEPVA
ncbi:MFS transporter [Aureliella helgolandensis]|uniref:Major Facilitator Superfamily protein n=1 Tax=Aureliella helgolandensis TaxID=2527968 RepID=A0A518GFT0_9BACT|nr:MFS transporter [Aureliella helgolandensis]QDV27461.1 Major Facilitator Superfamily protein [Aureliella helgolandensis]